VAVLALTAIAHLQSGHFPAGLQLSALRVSMEVPMPGSKGDGVVSGLILGFVIAFVFALVISFLPAEWFLNTSYLAILYALQVPAGIAFIPVATAVAGFRGESPRQVLLWACCGALAFDGLMLGFWPALYGQEGAALTAVATLLLWAFAWIVVAALAFAPTEPARKASARS
jgi:hypothetical protein